MATYHDDVKAEWVEFRDAERIEVTRLEPRARQSKRQCPTGP